MGSVRLPPWLRRGIEAGVFGGVLAVMAVVAYRWAPIGAGISALPGGIGASFVMAMPVFAIGVFAVA